jgi:hypothetical protein
MASSDRGGTRPLQNRTVLVLYEQREFRCFMPCDSDGVLAASYEFKSTQPRVRTVTQAWSIQQALQADLRVTFAHEPDGFETSWEQLMTWPGVGTASLF